MVLKSAADFSPTQMRHKVSLRKCSSCMKGQGHHARPEHDRGPCLPCKELDNVDVIGEFPCPGLCRAQFYCDAACAFADADDHRPRCVLIRTARHVVFIAKQDRDVATAALRTAHDTLYRLVDGLDGPL
jgi:hypothetical protein